MPSTPPPSSKTTTAPTPRLSLRINRSTKDQEPRKADPQGNMEIRHASLFTPHDRDDWVLTFTTKEGNSSWWGPPRTRNMGWLKGPWITCHWLVLRHDEFLSFGGGVVGPRIPGTTLESPASNHQLAHVVFFYPGAPNHLIKALSHPELRRFDPKPSNKNWRFLAFVFSCLTWCFSGGAC